MHRKCVFSDTEFGPIEFQKRENLGNGFDNIEIMVVVGFFKLHSFEKDSTKAGTCLLKYFCHGYLFPLGRTSEIYDLLKRLVNIFYLKSLSRKLRSKFSDHFETHLQMSIKVLLSNSSCKINFF